MMRAIVIPGLKLVSPNRNHTMTRGSRFAELKRVRDLQSTVRAHLLAAGLDEEAAPSRVVIVRLSSGELDRDNAWSSSKPVWDAIAKFYGLPNDRALQNAGDVRQEKAPRGKGGVRLELEWP